MENVILVDFDADNEWQFLRAIEAASKQKWKVIKGISNRNHGSKIQNLIRYFKYFLLPFRIMINKNKYGNILAWQQFYGLVLAFYFRIFHVKKAPNIVVMTFIYKPKNGIIGKIFFRFIKFAVTSKYISKIIVFAKSEAIYYSGLFGINEDMFDVEMLGIEDEREVPFKSTNDNHKYYVSAGRSNRDYEFLYTCWENDDLLYVISDECKYANNKSIKNLSNCFENNYMEKMRESYAVIIPLDDKKISSGQLVILQAFMFGKPVIVTENDTVADYVSDGVNGYIIDKSKDELLNAVSKIEKNYQELSRNARETFVNKFSLSAMGNRIGSLFWKGIS